MTAQSPFRALSRGSILAWIAPGMEPFRIRPRSDRKASESIAHMLDRFEIEQMAGGAKALAHDLFTNDVLYADCLFDLQSVPHHLLPLVSLFCRSLTNMGTDTQARRSRARLSPSAAAPYLRVSLFSSAAALPALQSSSDCRCSCIWFFFGILGSGLHCQLLPH